MLTDHQGDRHIAMTWVERVEVQPPLDRYFVSVACENVSYSAQWIWIKNFEEPPRNVNTHTIWDTAWHPGLRKTLSVTLEPLTGGKASISERKFQRISQWSSGPSSTSFSGCQARVNAPLSSQDLCFSPVFFPPAGSRALFAHCRAGQSQPNSSTGGIYFNPFLCGHKDGRGVLLSRG